MKFDFSIKPILIILYKNLFMIIYDWRKYFLDLIEWL